MERINRIIPGYNVWDAQTREDENVISTHSFLKAPGAVQSASSCLLVQINYIAIGCDLNPNCP